MQNKIIFVILCLVLFFVALGYLVYNDAFLYRSAAVVDISENQTLMLTDREYFPFVHKLLNSANQSIHIVMFSMNYYPDYPDSSVNMLLKDLENAAGRGLDVKVVVDEHATDSPLLKMLQKKGINIKFDRKDITTHDKLIIIDGKIVIIGSTNWSYYSFEKNHEANVVIYSKELADDFEYYFEKICAESG
ncbi:MAG: hypothetical protein J7K72_00710 [Candidatus Aenigmarchaeota archaeon]|nr:hypothetical protein [Candidatus Aenigmarchaeota archaeon]